MTKQYRVLGELMKAINEYNELSQADTRIKLSYWGDYMLITREGPGTKREDLRELYREHVKYARWCNLIREATNLIKEEAEKL